MSVAGLGQTIFITGAAGTIGAAIALAFARQGANLAVMDRAELDVLTALKSELLVAGAGKVHVIQGDLADVHSHQGWIDQIEENLGDIHCLVNNAGVGAPRRADMLELTPEAFDFVFDINIRGTFFITQKVMASMLQKKSSEYPRSIINVSSISVEVASPDRAEYCLSKSALGMLTKLLALRLASAGVSVFELRPGITHSNMTQPVEARYDKLIAEGLVPLGRWGEGQDMADIAISLASGKFSFATGSVINADGGLTIPCL
ncbi:3-ketoacyl-ACP reductase [Alcaligenes sp. 13f]|nr:3-ketoacyl-ACP reductase [Alcaligenes sp. 13f]